MTIPTEAEKDLTKRKRLNAGSYVAVILSVTLFLMVMVTLVFSILANDNTNELASSSDQQACMSIYNARKERAERDVATVRDGHNEDVQAVEDLRDDLYLQAQVALANEDLVQLQAIVDQAPAILSALAQARTARSEAVAEARKGSEEALDDYERAAELRESDPVAFLQECRTL